jgi:hypothetical protein
MLQCILVQRLSIRRPSGRHSDQKNVPSLNRPSEFHTVLAFATEEVWIVADSVSQQVHLSLLQNLEV